MMWTYLLAGTFIGTWLGYCLLILLLWADGKAEQMGKGENDADTSR